MVVRNRSRTDDIIAIVWFRRIVENLVDSLRTKFPMPDASCRVVVLPAKGLGLLRLGLDVAAQRASQVGDRGEDTPRQHVPPDLREPQVDLIQARGVPLGEVELDVRMRVEKCCHCTYGNVGRLILGGPF